MSLVLVIARYAIQEAVRRRVFTVVLALTAAFVALYGLAVWQVFRKIGDIHPPGGIEPKPFAGATIINIATRPTSARIDYLTILSVSGAIFPA